MNPSLVVYTGSMFSGKTSQLIKTGLEYRAEGYKVLFIKPRIDERYSKDEIVSHDGVKVSCMKYSSNLNMINKDGIVNHDVICIDEAQFFDRSVFDMVRELLKRGRKVFVAGLDIDFKGDPFGHMPQIMAIADEVFKFKATCLCGNRAWVSSKTIKSSDVVGCGGNDKYVPLCRTCFNKLRGVDIYCW